MLKKVRRFGVIMGVVLSSILLVACQDKAPNELRVGTIAGPETTLMETAAQVAAKRFHLKVHLVSFNDYRLPNTALAEGDIDANVFQHQPYLDYAKANEHYDLVTIGKTFVYPMGIYSNKINNLSKIKQNALAAIPNDPTNQARALLLLQKAGLIKLKLSKDLMHITPADIQANARHLVIRTLDAANLARLLDDVDLAAINTNFAVTAGKLPSRDALVVEDKHSPYANIIVARGKDRHSERLLRLVKAIQSQEVLEKAKVLFQGQAIPAWA